MSRAKTVKQTAALTKKLKREGKRVGLIFGCFDVLHLGHVHLFRDARKYVDYLIVGLENDKSIRLTKGRNRPVNTFDHRLQVLSELRSVDWIFKVDSIVNHNDKNAVRVYDDIVCKIVPHYLITDPLADSGWEHKKENAKKANIELLLLKRKKIASSTRIIGRMLKEL